MLIWVFAVLAVNLSLTSCKKATCQDGDLDYNGVCYFINEDLPYMMSDAIQACVNDGGVLAEIPNTDVQHQLEAYARSKNMANQDFWNGGEFNIKNMKIRWNGGDSMKFNLSWRDQAPRTDLVEGKWFPLYMTVMPDANDDFNGMWDWYDGYQIKPSFCQRN